MADIGYPRTTPKGSFFFISNIFCLKIAIKSIKSVGVMFAKICLVGTLDFIVLSHRGKVDEACAT